MKKGFKKIAMFLAIVMVISCAPSAGVFAAGGKVPAKSLAVKVKFADSEYEPFITYGTDYFDENAVTQTYSFTDKLPTVVFDEAKGVYLSTILDDLELDLDEVKSITVKSTDDFTRTYTKEQLFRTAYHYPALSEQANWESTSAGVTLKDATAVANSKVEVEPMIALEDNWYRLTNTPGGMTADNRFRLLFGMEDLEGKENGYTLEQKASEAGSLIEEIRVEMTGDNPYEDNPLTDIDSSWAKDYIKSMYDIEAVTGNDNNQFEPTKNVTRAEFATMLVKTLVYADLVDLQENKGLADVKEGNWAADYLYTAVEEGIIVKETSTGNVNPGRLITREEMATMIGRALDLESDTATTFKDKNSISTWALKAVNGITINGGMTGLPNGNFDPKGTSTKEMAATSIFRSIVNEGNTL